MSVGVEVQTVTKVKLKEPSKYQLIFHNDDVTPMEFVMAVLVGILKYSADEAYNITMDIHENGDTSVYEDIKAYVQEIKDEIDDMTNNFGLSFKCSIKKVEQNKGDYQNG